MSSSDDTVFMDLPLPPVPSANAAVQAIRIPSVVGDGGASAAYVMFDGHARLFARLDDFDRAPHQSPERCSSSVSLGRSAGSGSADETTPGRQRSSSRWSSSDEEASCYRERLSMFRCSESAERADRKRCVDAECAGCSNGRRKGSGAIGGMLLHSVLLVFWGINLNTPLGR